MRRRLTIYTASLLLAGLTLLLGVSVYLAHSNYIGMAKGMVTDTARALAGLLDEGTDLAAFVRTGSETRITIIAPDGAVMADSFRFDLAAMGNHLDRPEVQAAQNGVPEAFVRRSDSVGVDYIYYATVVPMGDSWVFLRAATPIAKVNGYLSQAVPSLIAVFLIIVLLGVTLSRRLIVRVTKPFESVERRLRALSAGEYAHEPITGAYGEVDDIVRGIDEVAELLHKNIAGLRDEKGKLSYILDNITDGLIVLDERKGISLINAAALAMFGAKADIVGKGMNYLTFDEALREAVDACVGHGTAGALELPLGGRLYAVTVRRLPESPLTMAAFTDVTEARESARRREEFFANASHELKTPLTAIKGFNELASMNNRDEGIKKYIDGIVRETDRMVTLIGGMLRLSELEGMRAVGDAPVSLAKVVGEVREALSPMVADKAVTFRSSGDAVVRADWKHAYELVKNLAENAVRYGEPGGKVTVEVSGDGGAATLIVRDDGIGIPPEEQQRVFERFYRAEKSRSQLSGGTGLGLSIVKHICALYGWKVSLRSKPGVGTEVTVTFG